MIIAILAATLGVCPQVDLIERLDDERIDVRDAATEQLRSLGAEVIPLLEKALQHDSGEVRTRARSLLREFPGFIYRELSRNSRFPKLKRMWSAVIESSVNKTPVPAEFADEVNAHQELDWLEHRVLRETPEALSPGRLFDELWRDGLYTLSRLSEHHGLEDRRTPSRELRRAMKHRDDGGWMRSLADMKPDSDTFQEICATVYVLRNYSIETRFLWRANRDRDTLLRLLVAVRRRPGEKAFTLPKNMGEAIRHMANGPWVKGIASGLARAFANERDEKRIGMDRLYRMVERRMLEGMFFWDHLEDLYEELARIERHIGDNWFTPGLLRPTRDQVPAEFRLVDRPWDPVMKWLATDPDLKPDHMKVVHAVLHSLLRRSGQYRDELLVPMLRTLSKEVVRRSR